MPALMSDIITLILGLTLILFGVQPMLQPEIRKNYTEAIKNTTLVIGGLFLLYWWNENTKANYAP
jgi:uncharacterized protein YjeT (DUF2065 family)